MTHLKISGVGNSDTFMAGIVHSPFLKAFPWAASSSPSVADVHNQTPANESIDRRELELTVGTSNKETKEEIERLFATVGLTVVESEFVEGEFPAGLFYDASDDDD